MTSTEELERKLQIKVRCVCACASGYSLVCVYVQQDESSKRYDQQLEQKKKLATGVISSRHASVELAPRVDAYKTKKWCTLCNVTVRTLYLLQCHCENPLPTALFFSLHGRDVVQLYLGMLYCSSTGKYMSCLQDNTCMYWIVWDQ